MQGKGNRPLFGHGRAEDLRSEEAAFRPLDDLLVDGLRWMIHYNRAFLIVNPGVYPGIPNKIDYPFLSLVL